MSQSKVRYFNASPVRLHLGPERNLFVFESVWFVLVAPEERLEAEGLRRSYGEIGAFQRLV